MIEFNDNKPIYRQILDYAFNRILKGSWKPGEMIPSVRELTSQLGVNNRTVLKALDELQALKVIEPKRGLGFLLAMNGADIVREEKRREFFEKTIPEIISEMRSLGITPEEVATLLKPGRLSTQN
ncbi:MAG: GntR family transcriptional regulator [Muribaculaceae bacterium]|nr:GntR family transcriptional regulator [Muribaculaceae bacterium]